MGKILLPPPLFLLLLEVGRTKFKALPHSRSALLRSWSPGERGPAAALPILGDLAQRVSESTLN